MTSKNSRRRRVDILCICFFVSVPSKLGVTSNKTYQVHLQKIVEDCNLTTKVTLYLYSPSYSSFFVKVANAD